MKVKKIEIELLSDTCVSDGGIYNSAVDMDICYDDYGFPYIPGKRIKGCLRECALELSDWEEKIDIKNLFGEKGDDRGNVVIKNAYIRDRESMIKVIEELADTPLVHPQNVLDCYSYVRTQTALDFDTGVADNQSLRTIRVANKGLIFEAEVLFLSENMAMEKDLEKCLAVFRHIGISRTRGLGEVKAILLPASDAKKECRSKIVSVPYVQDSTHLEYEISLKEPVICKSVGEQEAFSMDYIEGTKILGIIGQRLKNKGDGEIFSKWLKEGKFHCSNAYPVVAGKRFYEVPASVFCIKNDSENYRNKIYMESKTPSCDEGLQLNQVKHCYVDMTEDGKMMKYSVKKENRYHHSRPEDKSVGRSIMGKDGSQLYQISSIKEGQVFRGFIDGDSDLIQKLYALITENNQCMIGYGRNGEYGGCAIRVAELGTKEENKEEVNSFYALLKSPAIIYNNKAMYSTDVKDLQEEILANIMEGNSEVSRDIQLFDKNSIRIMQYTNITPIGGYNVTWGCRKPMIYTFDKGTVLVFRLPAEMRCKVKMGQIWIGERCMEGFGEVLICSVKASGSYEGKIVHQIEEEYQKEQNQPKDSRCDLSNFMKQDFVRKVYTKRFKEFLRFKASEVAADMECTMQLKRTTISLKPAVSNMALMCEENDSVRDVWANCRKRFEKASNSKDKKRKCAEKIIKYIRGIEKEGQLEDDWDDTEYPQLVCLMNEFEKQYHISCTFDKDTAKNWELFYLAELLKQIKYVLRQKNTNEGVAGNEKCNY